MIIKFPCNIEVDYDGTVYIDCVAKEARKELGRIELESNKAYGFESKKLRLPANASPILLQDFKSKRKGLGAAILCKVLSFLEQNGYTHIILNAVPIATKRFPNPSHESKLKLIQNYRRLGFRLVDMSSGLMKGVIRTVSRKCQRKSKVNAAVDNIAFYTLL